MIFAVPIDHPKAVLCRLSTAEWLGFSKADDLLPVACLHIAAVRRVLDVWSALQW